MYDVIIVGGGVAGLSSALFTAKAGLNTMVFDDGKSQITRVSTVQNIPGFTEGISGKDWIKNAKEQVRKFNGIINKEVVIEVKKNDEVFEVKTETDTYHTKYLVIASNTNKELLEPFGLIEKTNQYVPSGKTKSIPISSWNGETAIENLYLAGLISEIPSQATVAMGHGAAVGITVASKASGKPYMWHDA